MWVSVCSFSFKLIAVIELLKVNTALLRHTFNCQHAENILLLRLT